MRNLWLIPALVGLAVLYAVLDRDSGIRTWWRMRADLEDSRERIAVLQEQTERLGREVALLRDDPFAIERAIREDLRLARPGESVVRLPSADASSSRYH